MIENNFAPLFEPSLLEDQQNADGDHSRAKPGTRNNTKVYRFIFVARRAQFLLVGENDATKGLRTPFANGKNDDDFYIRDDFAQFRMRYAARIGRRPSDAERSDLLQLSYPATAFTILGVKRDSSSTVRLNSYNF